MNKIGASKMIDGLIKLDKVKEMTTFSTSTIYRLLDEGKFPLRIRLGAKKVFWVEEEIKEYMKEKMSHRY
jgi:prophage regulatory protein